VSRYRVRQNWCGKLIVQIEETIHRCEPQCPGSGFYDEWDEIKWRDARVEDLMSGIEIASPCAS